MPFDARPVIAAHKPAVIVQAPSRGHRSRVDAFHTKLRELFPVEVNGNVPCGPIQDRQRLPCAAARV
jgi:hypothetical protein